jgi:hypothetical protein
VILSMVAGGRRHQNLQRHPGIAITVLDDDWYSQVSLVGSVIAFRDDPGFTDIDRISQRYLGEPYDERDEPVVTAVMDVERWNTYGPIGESPGT